MEINLKICNGTHLISGAAGAIELLVDLPKTSEVKGFAIVAHPQPLLGGSAQHKIPHILAKSVCEAGWIAIRPNFRGVGATEGAHDLGVGESADILSVRAHFSKLIPNIPFVLIGFSFGAFVQALAADALEQSGSPALKVCLAGMPYGVVEGGRVYNTPQEIKNTVVIHGELDERVPLQSVMDWGRDSSHPIVVIPGADHFFTGKLPSLRQIVLNFIG